MAFHKVTVKDNWGRLSYSVGNKELRDGQKIKALWPDKTVTAETIWSYTKTGEIMDMGHYDHYSTQVFYLSGYCHGVYCKIPLESVELEVA